MEVKTLQEIKPEWKDAPEWAKYLAMDKTYWYWHSKEPEFLSGFWLSTGRFESIALANNNIKPKKTLEKRPRKSRLN